MQLVYGIIAGPYKEECKNEENLIEIEDLKTAILSNFIV